MGHGGGFVTGWNGGERHGCSVCGWGVSVSYETSSGTVGILADVFFGAAGFGTDGEIGNGDVCARSGGGAEEVNWSTGGGAGTCSLPVVEGEVLVDNSVTGSGGCLSPSSVDVQTVGVRATDEVVELTVRDSSTTTVGFDHVHLVGSVSVDIVVDNVRDGGICSERSHTTTS